MLPTAAVSSADEIAARSSSSESSGRIVTPADSKALRTRDNAPINARCAPTTPPPRSLIASPQRRGSSRTVIHVVRRAAAGSGPSTSMYELIAGEFGGSAALPG